VFKNPNQYSFVFIVIWFYFPWSHCDSNQKSFAFQQHPLNALSLFQINHKPPNKLLFKKLIIDELCDQLCLCICECVVFFWITMSLSLTLSCLMYFPILVALIVLFIHLQCIVLLFIVCEIIKPHNNKNQSHNCTQIKNKQQGHKIGCIKHCLSIKMWVNSFSIVCVWQIKKCTFVFLLNLNDSSWQIEQVQNQSPRVSCVLFWLVNIHVCIIFWISATSVSFALNGNSSKSHQIFCPIRFKIQQQHKLVIKNIHKIHSSGDCFAPFFHQIICKSSQKYFIVHSRYCQRNHNKLESHTSLVQMSIFIDNMKHIWFNMQVSWINTHNYDICVLLWFNDQNKAETNLLHQSNITMVHTITSTCVIHNKHLHWLAK